MAKEQKQAHPLFIAAIIGIPAIAVVIMLYFKTQAPPPDPDGEGSTPKKIVVKSEVLKNWEKAVKDFEKLKPSVQRMTIRMGDLEDKLLEKEDITEGKKALLADLGKLEKDMDGLLESADSVIDHYKKKFGVETEGEVLQKLSKMTVKEGNFGTILADMKRLHGDVKTRTRAVKALGEEGDHDSTGGTK